MIRIIGIIEVIIFYFAYFLKLFLQKEKGIKTNQLGKGNKDRKTVWIESLLRLFSIVIVVVMLVSIILNSFLIKDMVIRGTGLILFAAGTLLFIIAMITMRDNWRAGIPEEDKTEMVTIGIYKISRNPAFFGFDLTYIGICFTFGNIILVPLAVVTIILMHLQILQEEKFLKKTFDKQYLNYKNRVGRYFMLF